MAGKVWNPQDCIFSTTTPSTLSRISAIWTRSADGLTNEVSAGAEGGGGGRGQPAGGEDRRGLPETGRPGGRSAPPGAGLPRPAAGAAAPRGGTGDREGARRNGSGDRRRPARRPRGGAPRPLRP